MHYAQMELDRIKMNIRPQQTQAKPDPIQVLESAYHMTMLDAQNEVRQGVYYLLLNLISTGYRGLYYRLYRDIVSG